MDNKSSYLIVDAGELTRLIRENLALKKELLTGDACFPCDCCRSAAEHEKDCQGICEDCRLVCRCRKCGEAHKRFEWRGIVPETEPSYEDVEAVRRRITARGKGHCYD